MYQLRPQLGGDASTTYVNERSSNRVTKQHYDLRFGALKFIGKESKSNSSLAVLFEILSHKKYSYRTSLPTDTDIAAAKTENALLRVLGERPQPSALFVWFGPSGYEIPPERRRPISTNQVWSYFRVAGPNRIETLSVRAVAIGYVEDNDKGLEVVEIQRGTAKPEF